MRFTREKLLKNISARQLRNYQQEQGYAAFTYPRKELTINEMVKELYWHFSFSAHMSFGKHYDPVDYLNRVDVQRRIALDISRCLVTAKKLGEEIECSGATPEKIFNFMIADLSSHARCLSDKAMQADFGCGYQEAAFTVYEEVTSLIRRLKLTRDGFNTIRALPGAVLSDAPKTIPAAEEGCKDSAEREKSEKTVRPERPIAPMATTVNPAAEETTAEETAADEAEADEAKEAASEGQENEEIRPNLIDCKWKPANYQAPQPYEMLSPYGMDPDEDDEEWEDDDEDEEDDDDDDWYESSDFQSPSNLWKNLFSKEERLGTELAATGSQLATTGSQ